ncbi:MAG TPA: amino acid adenylation domain-containing protein [Roseiflexaceae bacterium]|nr:amino acid adenylation domain-containing protein [Roseiflexaceae bacterium]
MNIKKSVETFYPLSPMQQGMLFHTLYDQGQGTYVEQLILPLRGNLRIDAFGRAWEQIVQRHAALRTAFVWQGLKNPAQVVYRRVEIPWDIRDWRDLPPAQQQQELDAFLEADRQSGFVIEQPPLMRMGLFRTADDVYQFVWSQHHLLLDGWSLALVLRELSLAYESSLTGRALDLPQPRPYRDYIAWLQKQDMAQAERFWRAAMAGFHTATPLGVDRAAPGPAGYAEHELLLPPETAARLQALTRQHGLTVNTVFQGAWAFLLGCYSGERDVLFGATVAGRPSDLPGVEQMVGLFINTLPVRVCLPDEGSVLEWLQALQRQQAELRQYEYTPLVQIQGWSEVPRGQPLFESLVVFENYPATAGGAPGNGHAPLLSLGGMRAVEQTNYPLNLMAGAGAFRINYDRSRFAPETVERMAAHLAAALEQIAADPQRRLADLTLLTAEEQALLDRWNATAAPVPADLRLHDLVAAQAARTPDAPAVLYGDQTLPYAELEARANQLARFLTRRGVGPGDRVALCLERSVELPVVLLAVLKAGAAYVPLDPGYPRERLLLMLADARPTALVTQAALGDALLGPAAGDLPRVLVDSDAPAIAREERGPFSAAATPDDLAYILYTSGSTGRPKGVALEHRALVNLVAWHLADPRMAAPRRTLQFAPISFDVSFQEHLTTWSSGGALVLVDDETRRDGPALLEHIRAQQIERLFVPFVALAALAEAAEASATELPHLCEIITAGEQLRITPAIRAWLARSPGCRLYNHYGPTETHVVTACALEGDPAAWPELPTIGRPIANVTVHLLDQQLRPVPVGVAGELYIGGAALARGYFDRPDLTQERFIPNPFGAGGAGGWGLGPGEQNGEPGSDNSKLKTQHSKLYKSGDLARWLPDGTIEFLGRRDDQVKVRGFRVELGEVEAALGRHPQVSAASVTAQELAGGNRRLVAYVVPRDARPAFSELRAFLLEQLPEHMVPAVYVTLDALPLTPSGKVNRRALPSPEEAGGGHDAPRAAPRSQIEEMLAQIWSDVLQRQDIGIHDSFFELGGHSLLATQLVSRVRELCAAELPLRSLFEAPTIAGMAERIAQARSSTPEQATPPILPAEHTQPPPLSFAQQRLWFFDQLQPGSAAYTVASALRLQGQLDERALEQALDAIVRRHAVLRTTFDTAGGQPVQIIHPEQPFVLRRLDLGQLPEDEREREIQRLAAADAARTFDLRAGPLFDACLVQAGPEDHALLLVMHHSISDGWSLGVLMRELAACYTAGVAGQAPALPALPIQYADYALWQRDPRHAPLLEAQLGYWRGQLGSLAPLELPTDFPRPPVETLDGAVHEFLLPRALGDSIQRFARQEGATLFMTLLAAWQTLLARWSGQTDIAVGTPIAGRNRGETEQLIGYFLNTLVLRSDLARAGSFRALVRQVRDVCLAAYAHQDVPFEQVVDALAPERDLSRHPLFQVMFVLQNTAQAPLELPGLACSPLAAERSTTRFDLTLTMAEGPDGLAGVLEYNTSLFAPETIARLRGLFLTLLADIVARPDAPLASLALLPDEERRRLLVDWNATTTPLPTEPCIHQLIAAQAARRPDDTAVVFRDRRLTYRELERRAGQLAGLLQGSGVGPETRVGIFMERSLELPVALLGVLKAGAAYVPLDPSYPAERVAFMLRDSRAGVVLTQSHLRGDLPPGTAQVICLDAGWPQGDSADAPVAHSPAGGDNLAYVIYTSGSTGTPKGVMITHRNLLNFAAGMDQRLGTEPGSWLAVTSISFDISVLELLWTLARGFTVVVQGDGSLVAERQAARSAVDRPIQFSLFYFANDEDADSDRYRLLIEGARFADQHGFTAVWTPERHFHAFGGLYPNPSVTSAAIATITSRVQIRAGSVVLPLHNPVRVAEEWSVVDNLSHGRAGISFAPGWHADDFIFAPEHFAERRRVMVEQIDTVRRLWRGERMSFTGGAGNPVEIRIVPRPVQPELPFWLTVSGNPDSFRLAGELGANVLTHLLGQSTESLAEKIAAYRRAWHEHGHPGEGHVTLMLHTFVGRDDAVVRSRVAGPFRRYLGTSLDLIGNLMRSLGRDPQDGPLGGDDLEAVLDHAFERYYETGSLMGTPERCLQTVDQLKGIGVDEVACLIDFGVESEAVLSSLHYLAQLRERSNPAAEATPDYSLPAQIARHRITHLQCTPSLARMLALDPPSLAALGGLGHLLLGGEALPAALWEQLRTALPARLLNMYGPTETTIWSTTHDLAQNIAIGRPIANTQIYVVDPLLQPTPIGVPGDLYIGGLGLARGYLERPDLTAERFIPDPFGTEPGARLYRTGDRARWLADGTLEFLGRVDTQIKLRGYRIEIGEIEAALSRLPEVREAAVIVHEGSGEQQLVAYIVPAERRMENGEPGVEDAELKTQNSKLKTRLAERLPAYMVPSAFVLLDALPLTPNGKIDRVALPAPEAAHAEQANGFVAPQSPAEQVIASVWAGVLGLERVGARDNFFQLGGNSLLATLLVSRLREALGIDLPVRSLFEAPTVGGLAGWVERHRAEQQGWRLPPMGRAPRGAPLPLSFAQQRLWFLNQLQPDSWVYNEPTAIRLAGALDQDALERSVNALVQRHEALRTTFALQGGEPVQIIQPYAPQPLALIDLQDIPAEQREEAVQRLVREDARRLFDLERGPLFRVTLVRSAPDDHILLVAMHHIICDGWSKSVIVGELTEYYNQAAAGRAPAPAELALQYADYAVWQREWLGSQAVEAQLAYWREQLRDAPLLQLPTDYARPPMPSYGGAVHGFAVDPQVSRDLAALSRREGVSLFMTLLAAWQILLARYSDQEDIVVGTPIAGRTRRETEAMVGFFINTLVLRSDLSGRPSFRTLLARVREVCLAAYSHQDLPFEQVVEIIQPERDLSRQPLFQVIFSLQNTPRSSLGMQGLTPQPAGIAEVSAKFDLDLNMVETDDGLLGSLNYSVDLFTEATARRMAGHFSALLAAIAADPEQPVADLPMLTDSERDTILRVWNATAAPYPREAALPALFSAQAARTPDAVAVVEGQHALTYAELEHTSDALARRLVSGGVRPGDAVGLALERSRGLVVATLAALKAGAFYVPLDPTYPAARLAHILDDTRPRTVVTTAALREALALEGWPCLCLDSDAPPAGTAALPPARGGNSVAYVMYTSGSTGLPKGVLVTHQAIVRLVINTDYAQLTPDDRVGHLSNTAFDAATFEIWGALLNGARLVVIPREVLLAPHDFAACLREQQISAMFLTSALFSQIAATLPDSFAGVRHLLVGGDAVEPRGAARVLREGPPVHLVNAYGPTESTTFSVCHPIDSVAPSSPGIPIGRPIRQTTAYVLDRAGRLVPAGVMGELYIGGDGLALGYLNQPALTAERFVPDPFSAAPGARLYRTGDLVRWRADGAIEFVGRRDRQIKLRGFRIELGEIEAVLAQHPDVAECLVQAIQQPGGEKRLVAYIVPAQKPESASSKDTKDTNGSGHEQPELKTQNSTLRTYLRERLPEYMVPSAFVAMEAFPLTPNGKLDRRALPVPGQDAVHDAEGLGAQAEGYVAPRDLVEFQLARIWEELLQVFPISITSNFFDLGGHSLLAMKLIETIRQELGRTLPLTAIFQWPTISELAVGLRDQSALPDWSPLVPLQPRGGRTPFFCVHPAGGTPFCYAPLAHYLGDDRPFYGFQSYGFEADQRPDNTIEAMAERYLRAMRAVQPHGPYALGGWSIGGVVALEMAQQLARGGERVALLAVIDGDLPPPELQKPDADIERFLNTAAILMMLARFENLPMKPEEFQALSPEAQLEIAMETARSNNIIPPDATPEQVGRITAVLQANFAALLRYQAQTYPGRITFLRTEPPPMPENERGDTLMYSDETRGWKEVSGEPIEVYTLPGQHVTLMSEPYVRTVAQVLHDYLERHDPHGNGDGQAGSAPDQAAVIPAEEQGVPEVQL